MNIYTELYTVRVGEPREFDRGLTKSMPCMKLSVEGVRQGSDYKYALY